jgi:uncharacterized membrane protein YhaH (DUF805 family)
MDYLDQDAPYSPPRAGYAGKNHIIYEDMRPLSLTQRLNRLRYACYQLTATVVVVLVAALLGVLSAAAGVHDSRPITILLALLAAAGVLAMMVYMIGLTVRRLHDLDRTGWLVLLMFAPVLLFPLVALMGGGQNLLLLVILVQPLFMLYLFTAAGSTGMNGYGTPNPPNSIIVKIFGGIWWFLCVLALLLNLAMVVFSIFAPELLSEWGGGSQLQQLEELERLFKQLQ